MGYMKESLQRSGQKDNKQHYLERKWSTNLWGMSARKLLNTRCKPLANNILGRVMNFQSDNMKWKNNRLIESHYREGSLGKRSLERMETQVYQSQAQKPNHNRVCRRRVYKWRFTGQQQPLKLNCNSGLQQGKSTKKWLEIQQEALPRNKMTL